MKYSKKKKKATRRSSQKYPALNPNYNLKSRQELLDYDYLDKLNEEELEFLNRFTEEEIHASFSENNEENLNKTEEEKREIYNRNNARNSDLLTRKKSRKLLTYMTDKELETKEINMEDYMINLVDGKKK